MERDEMRDTGRRLQVGHINNAGRAPFQRHQRDRDSRGLLLRATRRAGIKNYSTVSRRLPT